MTAPVPTFAGWYPDPDTGGTRYWEGSHWTGDTRPRRRMFAAASAHRGWGIGLTIFGVIGVIVSPGQFGDAQAEGASVMSSIGAVFSSLLFALAFTALGIYLWRGQGPTTKAVVARVAAEKQARALAERQAAELRARQPYAPTAPMYPGGDAATVAQINALANPETARALQNLQNLLYTHAISDEEFQAAKAKLLGTQAPPDSLGQIAKLVELHRAGILSDVEFAAAKAKALGI